MTPKQQASIDEMNYEDMLRLTRNAPSGHVYFVMKTEVCDYFQARMTELKKTADHVRASKSIGWDGPDG